MSDDTRFWIIDRDGKAVYKPELNQETISISSDDLLPFLTGGAGTNTPLDMWQENISLHKRFNAPRSIKRSVRFVKEEVKEVIAEAEAPDIDRTKLAHEIADVIMVLFGLAIAAQVSFPDITDAIAIVNKKNAMKTTDTHYLDQHTGKITRLQKLPIKGGGGA